MNIQRRLVIRLVLLLPFLLLLALSFDSLRRGKPGAWHDRCVEFWNNRQWHEIRALGDNLHQIGFSDAETLSFAMLASEQLHSPDDVTLFAQRLLKKRPLNWKMEIETARLFQPGSLSGKTALFRTRMITGLFGVLSFLHLLSLSGHRDFLPWISLLSIAGCLLVVL